MRPSVGLDEGRPIAAPQRVVAKVHVTAPFVNFCTDYLSKYLSAESAVTRADRKL